MSGSTAKAERRAKAVVLQRQLDTMTEGLLQVHDRLHKDDVAAAHELIHELLGAGKFESDVAPLGASGMSEFDKRFAALCVQLNARAGYVLAVPATEGRTRLLTGGHQDVNSVMDAALRGHVSEPR